MNRRIPCFGKSDWFRVDAPRLIKRHVRWVFDSKKVQGLMRKAGYDKQTIERINREERGACGGYADVSCRVSVI